MGATGSEAQAQALDAGGDALAPMLQRAARVNIQHSPFAGQAIEKGNRMDAILGKFSPRQRALMEKMLVSYAGRAGQDPGSI